jgi:hypothetical protein
MKRIRIMGLCIVAAFALSAVAASSASAGEYGQCKSTSPTTGKAIKKGEFTDVNCQVWSVKVKNGKEVKAKKGHFEWFPGPSPSCEAKKGGEYTDSTCATKSSKPKKGKFEKPCGALSCAGLKSSTGEAVLEGGPAAVKCTASTGEGEITGVKTDREVVKFTGCEAAGQKCTSLRGATKEGEIVTNVLETTLIDGPSEPGQKGEKGLSGLEPKEDEVWLQFANVAGAFAPYLAEFGCTGVAFIRVSGSVSGITTPLDVMGTTSTQELGKGKAEQDLIAQACSDAAFTKCAAPFASTQNNTGTQITNEAVEVRDGESFPT